MSRFNFTIVLGDNLSPFAPSKHYDYEGVGSLVSLFGTALANQQSEINTDKVNRTNERMFNQQLSAQSAWNKIARDENRYLVNQAYERQLQMSDPAFIKKRYLEAGINPAFAFDSGAFNSPQVSTGSVPSQGQVPSPHSAVAPDPTILSEGISNAVNTFLAAQKQEADISYLKQKQVNETMETIGKVQNYKYVNEHYKALTDQILQEVLFGKQTWDARARFIDILNDLNQADIQLKEAQSSYQNIINSFEPQRQQLLLKEIDNQILQIRSSIRKNDSDAAYSSALKALTNAQEKGVKLDNDTKDKIADYLIQQEAAKADFEDFKAQREGKSYVEGEAIGRTMPGMDTSGHVRSYRRYSSNYEYYRDGRSARKKDSHNGGVR